MHDIVPSINPPRQHLRGLHRIEQQSETAVQQIAGVHYAARRGIFETMQTGMARRAAELAVPDQADLLQAINMAAGFVTVNVISGMYRR